MGRIANYVSLESKHRAKSDFMGWLIYQNIKLRFYAYFRLNNNNQTGKISHLFVIAGMLSNFSFWPTFISLKKYKKMPMRSPFCLCVCLCILSPCRC
jgi:hypothetical protein